MSPAPEGDWRPPSDDAAPGCNRAKGVIKQMSYLGSESVFEVEVEGGRRIRVLRSNLASRDPTGFGLGEPVWLTWRAAAASVLSS
jgi:spermidine/putrescine transport system ATP-binding protein